ncbi:unnamed protein product [Parnassius apollo]|uniref:(apollo) hypothetical protein n=1 Tax=Parnassius apollo TaxID=110799 RepID=A0A8S3WR51_PARAO|nr:unnamed protein product [Parnassius apollo]
MGNTQANEKQSKTGKSPAKGKHFMRNLNKKGSIKESKKRARKKSNAKRETFEREFDKTPDSDNNETIEASDNDTAECVFKTSCRGAGGVETSSVQSEVTVSRCEARARSPTRDQSQPPLNDSNSESVFTEPLTPLAVELNQCYYSAESDSAHDEPFHTLTPTQINVLVDVSPENDWPVVNMPHADAISPLTHDIEKEIKSDIFDENCETSVNERTMGSILSRSKQDNLEPNECSHDFLENRLKSCPGQTSFTLSKHRKVDLPPVTACERSLTVIDNDKDRRHSSLSETPVIESNVLRKVASLTLDKLTDTKIVRPKFVPEKLDFQLYEKFEDFDTKVRRIRRKLFRRSTPIKNNRALVQYIEKTVILNTSRTAKWFRIVMFTVKRNFGVFTMECDVRTGLIIVTIMQVSDSRPLYDIKVPKCFDVIQKSSILRQMLLNWFISSVAENSHLKNLLSSQDLKNIGIQYCTHLLAAGVLRQISDKDAPTENVFKPNLMYYWTHMEAPALQPVTPGRLQMCTWPPDKEINEITRDNSTYYSGMENDQFSKGFQNNIEEINDINEAKVVISQLKKKLQELEYQLQKVKINNQIEILNKNLQNSFISLPESNYIKDKVDVLVDRANKEVQTSKTINEINKLTSRAQICPTKYDSQIRTNYNDDNTLGISRLAFKNGISVNESENQKRSEKIENYCKLNKSREYNKPNGKDGYFENIDNDNLLIKSEAPSLPVSSSDILHDRQDISLIVTCESSSDTSFASTYTSSELINNRSNNENLLDLQKNEIIVQNATCATDKYVTKTIFSKIDQYTSSDISQTLIEDKCEILQKGVHNSISQSNFQTPLTETKDILFEDDHILPITLKLTKSVFEPNEEVSSPPPPSPGKTPSPPPAPGTHSITPELMTPAPYITPIQSKPFALSVSHSSPLSDAISETNTISQSLSVPVSNKEISSTLIESVIPETNKPLSTYLDESLPQLLVSEKNNEGTTFCSEHDHQMSLSVLDTIVTRNDENCLQKTPSTPDIIPPSSQSPPLNDTDQFTSKIPVSVSIPTANTVAPLVPSMPDLVSQPSAMPVSIPPPPPTSGLSPPPPPPMPGIGQASHPLVTGTGPPSSPMPGTGVPPPPPPMPGISPPPPLTPEMGPPLPPLPEMDPPPPPMPGVGPPPPPMPGMGPPPPPMPGMGPPPPPMPGMGPPPPMPGMGPPPPPMPGMGPPPPPMPGMGPPPPPMPGMGPPPPPMPGMGPPPPPIPGMGPPPPPMPGMGPPPPPMPGVGLPPPPLPVMGPPQSQMPGMGPPPPPMPGVGQTPTSGSNLQPPPLPPHIPGSNIPAPPGVVSQQAGPLPFPTPPVGGWNMQRATLRKIPVKPAAPMKPLYWTRILAAPVKPISQAELDPAGLKPLWLEIEETSLDNIDEFTDLFSRQVVKAPVKKKVEVKAKIQPVKLLDSKRSQNVGILAQSLHLEFSEIENAIYNFDTSVVSLETLQQIYDLRASDEELMQIKEHLKSKPDIPLDKPEAFLHDLSGIPNFAERISCFMFQAEFEDGVNTTMHKLDNLKHTCEFLTTSEPLKQLFAIILTLGNYMNGGNCQRGQADGFGLEILAKLKDVKSKQSQVTLLHFIVRTYMRARGGALSERCVLPVPEPGDVVRAAALDFADVAAHLQALRTRLQACREQTKKVIECDAQRNEDGDSPSGENTKRLEVFKEKMTTFLDAAEEKLKTENDNLEECRAKFIATMKFYQYTPKCGKVEDCEPKEFFSLWTSFCSDFKDIFKKEEQIAIKEKLKETKKLQEERKSLTQPKKEGGLKARLQKLSGSKK